MALDRKQKILIPLIIIAFIIVIWQSYNIFSGPKLPDVGGGMKAQKQTAPMVAPAALAPAPTTAATSQAMPPSAPETAANGLTQKEFPEELPANTEQSQYLKLVNQYQLLKMQHMLLEEEVAIAAAKQKIAQMNIDAGGQGYSDSDSGYTDSGVITPADENALNVVYIDYQDGRWHATLNNHGQFEEVVIGSRLSDGSKIISIDRRGVVTKRGNQLLKLTFGGVVPLTKAETQKFAPTAPIQVGTEARPQIQQAATAPAVVLPVQQQQVQQQALPVTKAPVVVTPPAQVSQTPAMPASTPASVAVPVMQQQPKQALPAQAKPQMMETARAHQLVPAPQPQSIAKTEKSLALKPAEAEAYTKLAALPAKNVVVTNEAVNSAAAVYSLQVSVFNNLKPLNDFVAKNKLENVAFYLQVPHGKKDRYILVLGKYTTIDEAKSALSKLQPEVKKLKPWVKPIKNDHLFPVLISK